MFFRISLFLLSQFIIVTFADHYKGGSISWKPMNPFSLVNPVRLIITQRQSWTFSRYPCNQTTISNFTSYNDTGNSVPATLTCISSAAACTTSLFQTINAPLYCTDFSILNDVSTGTLSVGQSLALNSIIDIAWRGTSWALPTLMNQWSLVSRINLTPTSTNKINSSPVTGSVPVLRFTVNQVATIQILAADWDTEQVVRCRWSYQSSIDECGDTCFDLPNAVIIPQDCDITWTAVLRTADVANGLNQSTYIISVTVEDFEDDASTTPLSSVPHQMLIHVFTPRTGACSTTPTYWSAPRRNYACFGVGINTQYTFNFYVRVNCPNHVIVDFPSMAPLYAQKNITQVNNDTWLVSFRYRAPSNETGVQPLCVTGVDNYGVSSPQYCLAMAVGAPGTAFIQPTFTQGSASPLGTVLATQRRFSIRANVAIKRPTRFGSQIRIYVVSTDILVWWIDTRYSPDVFYINNTLVFYVRNFQWTLGETYYVYLLEGVATADQYCGMESPVFGNNRIWQFTIWDPSMSSTTTPSTTTTTATIGTVTTRSMATTTANTLFTTTGITANTTSATIPTTATTTTTATTATTTTTTTQTSTTSTSTASFPDASVIYPKQFEQECVQPVTIASAIVTIATIPIHIVSMIILFVKLNAHFQQEALKLHHARRIRFGDTPSVGNAEERQRFV